jgi:hypothetical protein
MRPRAFCRPWTAVGSFLTLLLTLAFARAGVHTTDLTFRSSQFHIEFAGEGFQVVLGEDMDVSDEAGAPQLPVEPMVIALPGHQNVTAVTSEVGKWQALQGQHLVLPGQKQQVLSAEAGADAVTQPDSDIYRSYSSYPSAPARWTGTSYRHDSTYVQVLVYPVRYIGAEKRLEVCGEVKVKVEAEAEVRSKSEIRNQKSEGRSSGAGDRELLAGGPFEYVIVTGTGLDTVFRRLADWKTEKGVPAVVRTVEWVYTNYTGRDHAEQLRNYLKTLPDSGVRYVLLGGDVDVVPFRKAYAMSSDWGSMQREDSLPCDLYFADLQGSWDANNNNVFGEVDDSVDLYADLSVGRAPVNDVAQAQTFVRKVLDYEHAAVPGYQNKGLFFAMVLWQNPYTDMGVHKNKMEQQSFASGYSLTKLYQSLGNESHDAVMQAMRENQNFLNHDGHGWYDVMSCGQTSLRTADADTITNTGLGVLYSIGCWTTAFDFVSIGEAFVTNPNGGTVATIGNSSYGWGSPGNPGFGYSDKFDNHFWHAITSDDIYRVGDALAAAKEYYAPFSHDQNVYRWHQYDVNLMGDPEMPVWTALPETLDVATAESIGPGSSRVLVAVSHNGNPIKGALVCLSKGTESYSRGLSDGSGQVWLDATPQAGGDFTLTVTAHNYLPVERTIPCAGSCVSFAGWLIDDSLGNRDGIVNESETILVSVRLRNGGTQASGPASMVLRCDDPYVVIEESTAEAAPLAAGDSVLVRNAFRFAAAESLNNGHMLRFDLLVADSSQSLVFHPVVVVGGAVLGLDRWWLTHPPLSPGQTGGVGVRMLNTGYGYGHGTWCRLTSLDNNISVLSDSLSFGNIPPESSGLSRDSFVVSVSASCPTGHAAKMLLHLAADDFSSYDTLELLVGAYGFTDNMESGEAKWTHAGAGDLWHLTSYRTHSGASAWYCGDEASRQYNNLMDASLITVPFSVPQGCTLRFWRWFKTPNYGVDGIRVIVVREGAEETLDFLGTGGALGREWSSVPVVQCSSVERESGSPFTRPLDHSTTRPLLNQDGWAEEKYDLSWLGLGEQVELRLAFVSDGDTVDEGFYVDDVSVTGGGPPVTVAGVLAAPGLFPALDVWPNPFRSQVQIRYGASGDLPRLSIYNAAGRIVRRLPASRVAAWDGRDDHGRGLPAGTYFIEARTRTEHRVANVRLVR